MTVKRVINEDTEISFFELGDAVTTGNLVAGTWYLIGAMAAENSIIPKGLKVGDFFLAQSALTLAEGDSVQPVASTKFCGFQNVDGTMDKDQVDVTTICDETTSYRAGRLTFSLSGTLVVETSTDDEETATDIVLGNLITLLSEQTDGTYNRSEVGKDVNVMINLTAGIAGADVRDLVLFTPAQITSGGFSGGTNSAKTADVSLSITSGAFNPAFVKSKRYTPVAA